MTDLTRQTFIDPLALRQRDCFATLLAEAQRRGWPVLWSTGG